MVFDCTNVEHWWNDTDKEKQEYGEKHWISATLPTTGLTSTDSKLNPGFHGERPATNCLSNGTVPVEIIIGYSYLSIVRSLRY